MKKSVSKIIPKAVFDKDLKKSRIFLVEDDGMIASACESGLKKAGFTVEVIRDGAVAAKKIKEESPDIVLLDLMLPGMTGEQILKVMNDNRSIKKIPVIVLSAKSDQANIKNCLRMGARDYLVKSNFSLEEIIKKVKKNI